MTDTITIPLNKLTVWSGNVRKTHTKVGLSELAASIKAHGLQQNLVVKKNGKAYAVVAGGRRLKALQLLAKEGDIAASFDVPCRIIEADNATEISLAENVVREQMHPADQFDAFRKLVDAGSAVEDVGERFGVTKLIVEQRLKLSRVSPKVLKAYRAGDLTLEQVMAFTVTDDRALQERVLADLRQWDEPRDIRAALTEDDIAATDKRVRFITLAAYEQAGGKIKRDLFSDDEQGIYIEDPAFLASMVAEKLEQEAVAVRAEGWKWVETHPEFGYEQRNSFRRIVAEQPPLSEADEIKLGKLQAEYEALNQTWLESDDDAKRPKRLDTLERQIARYEDREGVWTAEQFAVAGAVVSLGHDGSVSIDRGLVRPEDMPKSPRKEKAEATAEGTPGLSAALIESLTAQKSAAVGAALMHRPDIALAAVVHAILLSCHDAYGSADRMTCLKIFGTSQSLRRVEGSRALGEHEQRAAHWSALLPASADDLWDWCLAQPQAVLLEALAFGAARCVDTVQQKHMTDAGNAAGNQIAKALTLDMADWFTPTAENYFSRIGKPQVIGAVTEATGKAGAPAWQKMKKAELAVLAEREVAGTRWLPDVLR